MIKNFFLMVIIIFIICLILQHRVDDESKKKYKTVKTILSVVLAILMGVESTLIYDFFVNKENGNQEVEEETQQSDEQKVLYPSVAVATEKDGNFLFELEQKEGRTVYGFEISISFPYSDYDTVIIWEYEEPQWFSIPAGEYEITIYNHVDYYEKYPIKIEEHGNTHIYLPIYDYRG